MNSRRGGIFLADLDPVRGKEIAKTRPVVVVSNDLNNRFSDTVNTFLFGSGLSGLGSLGRYFSSGLTEGLAKRN